MPNLDRADDQIKVIVLPPDCFVCGNDVNPKFLESWNGIDICKRCKREIYEEITES